MIEELNDIIVSHWKTFREMQARDEPVEEAALVIEKMLHLKPWETSPCDVDEGPSPWPATTAGGQSWPQAQKLMRRLDALAGVEQDAE